MLFVVLIFIFITILTLAVSFIALILLLFIYVKLRFEPGKSVCKSNARLDGKTVLVTGGNQGIGLETARDLAARGAKVVIACRDVQKSAEAIADIINTTENKDIEYKYLDLCRFSSIRKFAEDFNQNYDRLDILINNAGCAGLKPKASEDGIDIVMQVNYLGPFLLTNLLLDKIKASPAGRIVIVSSLMYMFGKVKSNELATVPNIHYIRIYCNTKLCDILWTKALAKRLPSHVTVNSLHPGVVKTDIFKRFDPYTLKFFMFLLDVFDFKSPKEGAQTSIYLAVAEEVTNVSGKFFQECREVECSKADNDDLVEEIWNKSVILTT